VVVHGRSGGVGSGHLVNERLGDGGGGEDVVGGGGPLIGEALHPLDVEPVLLEVAGDVLPGEALHVHELHDGLGHRVLDAQVRHHVDEALVQLRRPHQPGPLARGVVAVVIAVAAVPGRGVRLVRPRKGGERGGRRGRGRPAQPRHRGRRRPVHVHQRAARLRRDAEGGGQARRDQRLGQRDQLVGSREARLPLHDAIILVGGRQVQIVGGGGGSLLPHPWRGVAWRRWVGEKIFRSGLDGEEEDGSGPRGPLSLIFLIRFFPWHHRGFPSLSGALYVHQDISSRFRPFFLLLLLYFTRKVFLFSFISRI
jgi:hypothetical protein